MKADFWSEVHKPPLFSAFLYFHLSSMVEVLLGPLTEQMLMSQVIALLSILINVLLIYWWFPEGVAIADG